MKILTEISEGTLGLEGGFERLDTDYRLRKSARAILQNEKGDIAIQFLETYGYHKLPGGGVEPGEAVETALKREILEEVGCACEIQRPVGVVIEYRNKYQMLHLSYCYVATVSGVVGQPQLEVGEIEEGQVTLWMSASEALKRMSSDEPGKFEGHFILEREKAFLDEYLEHSN